MATTKQPAKVTPVAPAPVTAVPVTPAPVTPAPVTPATVAGEQRRLTLAGHLPVREAPDNDEQPARYAIALIIDAHRDECADGGHAAG